MKILSLILLLAACTHKVPTNRSDFRLINQDGFLISNIYVNPVELESEDERILIDYKIVVKNQTDKSRLINLNGAFIMIGLRTVPIGCASHEKKQEQFTMTPGQTVAIDCKILLNKQEGVFQISDYKSLIEIPLDNTKARFTYLLRAEDFQ
ncbi:hypothetical protein ACJVC5_09540 [Peredibacter sp. HCB2-198]|uniref:hypothetical protein n=1 Tax=Peredibacter sp. HCB2-198 TaxID=3383025 RepID=UPI0038B4802B